MTMRRWIGCAGMLVVAAVGCSGRRLDLYDYRPPTTPAPRDVRAEIRDARFFLPYPDDSIGPPSGMQPREALHSYEAN